MTFHIQSAFLLSVHSPRGVRCRLAAILARYMGSWMMAGLKVHSASCAACAEKDTPHILGHATVTQSHFREVHAPRIGHITYCKDGMVFDMWTPSQLIALSHKQILNFWQTLMNLIPILHWWQCAVPAALLQSFTSACI